MNGRSRIEMLLDMLKAIREKPSVKYSIMTRTGLHADTLGYLLKFAIERKMIEEIRPPERKVRMFNRAVGYSIPSLTRTYYRITEFGREYLNSNNQVFVLREELSKLW